MTQTKITQELLWKETDQIYEEVVELQNERRMSNNQGELNASLIVIAGELFKMNQHLSNISKSLAKEVYN